IGEIFRRKMLKLHSLRSFRFNILPHLPERGVYLSTFVGDNFIIRGDKKMIPVYIITKEGRSYTTKGLNTVTDIC
ncbi:hypothetical protein, partial [Huintestinicola sp.]